MWTRQTFGTGVCFKGHGLRGLREREGEGLREMGGGGERGGGEREEGREKEGEREGEIEMGTERGREREETDGGREIESHS